MVNTDILDPELAEIDWRRLNFPWCTIYSTKIYRQGLDIIIHKYLDNFQPHRLRQIMLFYTEANIHNKHLGKFTIKNIWDLYPLNNTAVENLKRQTHMPSTLTYLMT